MGNFAFWLYNLTFFLLLLGGVPPSCLNLNFKKNSAIPLDQLQEKLNSAFDGEVILIEEGEYEDIFVRINNRFSTNVTIKAVRPGSVIIKGNSRFSFILSQNITLSGFLFDHVPIRSSIIIANSSNIIIKDNYFYACGNKPKDPIIRIENQSSNNEIIHNTFDDSRSICIGIMAIPDRDGDRDIKNNEISRNYFVNTKAVNVYYPNAKNGMETIQLGQGIGETYKYEFLTSIKLNLFENIVGDRTEIISVKTSKNFIVGNTFLNNNSGISLRLGDFTEVSYNYLKNTNRGIRLFGKGHLISNNFIFGGYVGIDMPSSDFKNNEHMARVGYFQQSDIILKENIIHGPKTSGISIGQGSRSLVPDSISIERNRIYIDKSQDDFLITEKAKKSRINFINNTVVFDSDLNDGIASSENNRLKIESESELDFKHAYGYEPFKSNDPKVGSTWRRPVIK